MSTTEYLHLHAALKGIAIKNESLSSRFILLFDAIRHSRTLQMRLAQTQIASGLTCDTSVWIFAFKSHALYYIFSPHIYKYMLSRIHCMSPVICDGIQYLRWYDVDWPQFPSATSILYASCNDIIKMTFTTAKTSQKKMCKQLNSQPKWRW